MSPNTPPDGRRGLLIGIGLLLLISASGVLAAYIVSQQGATLVANPTPPPCPLTATATTLDLCFASAITKQDWVNAVTESFNAAQHKTAAGQVITVRVVHGTSGGQQQNILDGKLQPVAWSPGDQSWVDSANQTWKDRTGQPLTSGACPPTVYAPIGFGMWKPMATALGWPDKNVSWDSILELAADPEGWARYGHPEWGQFTFGHPHAVYSNFGMLMTAEVALATFDQTGPLTLEMVQSESVFEAMRQLEQHTYHYGVQSRNLVDLMAAKGPAYLHAVFTAEAEVLKANTDHADKLQFPLVFVFPSEGTFWTEQPYCILDGAEWVTDAHREAAEIYQQYLLAREQQEKAVDNYLRPVDATIPLHAPIALENGTNPVVTQADVPPLTSPSGPVADALKDLFLQTKKKATFLLVLDTSGSMSGDKMDNAKEATSNFILRLEPEDEVVVIPFSSAINELQRSGPAREVAEGLSQEVLNLKATGGTSLYDAICHAVRRANDLQAADNTAGEQRLYGIVVLTDGLDSGSAISQQQLFDTCLPTGEDVEGIKVFTIAYGGDADKALLKQIAERTNGKTFSGDPATIEQVYLAISAEQ